MIACTNSVLIDGDGSALHFNDLVNSVWGGGKVGNIYFLLCGYGINATAVCGSPRVVFVALYTWLKTNAAINLRAIRSLPLDRHYSC